MPRSPDPALESRLIAAAIRLLDRGGESSITLRAVAREAETTTPSLYERFPSRDALMQQLVDHVTDEIMTLIEPKLSIEAIYCEYLRYSRFHPKRLNLSVSVFWARFVEGKEMPAYDLLKGRIQDQIGVRGRAREDLALAIATLAFGTAQGMIAAGVETRQAAELRRSSLHALRMLLGAFPRGEKARGTSKGGRAKKTSG